MVDPITLGSSLALTGFGVYLLNRYRKQRQARLRALALLQKYSTSSRIALHEGRMRLLVSMPQVHQLPEQEQAAWRERDERRDRNYLELDLIQPRFLNFLWTQHRSTHITERIAKLWRILLLLNCTQLLHQFKALMLDGVLTTRVEDGHREPPPRRSASIWFTRPRRIA